MVIGLHGSSTACALRVAEEVHSTGEEPAITQHLLVVENNVQGHLNKQTIVIHKHALVKYNLLYLLDTFPLV